MATRDEIYAAIRNADAAGDTASVQKLGAYLQTMPADAPASAVAASPASLADRALNYVKNDVAAIPSKVGNLAAGLVRGAGSIGATLLAPYDMASDALDGKGLSLDANKQRRADMDATLRDMGADPNSLQYKVGKLGGEVAGTAGAGGVVANGARFLGAPAPFVDAIASGGFAGGGNAFTRAAGGAINGGATAGLVDPKNAIAGTVLGGAAPPLVKGAGILGEKASDELKKGAASWMQSALKPTIAQRKSGDADVAIKTLLDNGINPNKAGVEKLRAMIDNTDNEITRAIAGSNATVDKQAVLDALKGTKTQFGNQVSPAEDLATIQGVENGFVNHPSFPSVQTAIPVQDAQELKRGTYQVLSKKYGQMGTADTEAQKTLARGLKDEIATAVPGISDLNAQQSALLKTLDVTERRALLELNKNPMGLAALAHNPIGWAAFMADRSAAFKSLAAHLMNKAAPQAGNSLNALSSAASSPLLRGSAAAIEANP